MAAAKRDKPNDTDQWMIYCPLETPSSQHVDLRKYIDRVYDQANSMVQANSVVNAAYVLLLH